MDYFDSRDLLCEPVPDLSEERIQKSFEGKNIFITGSSGFLGKVLLEKILRSCPVNKIYLLFRVKKDVQPEERLIDLLKEDIFEKARLTLGNKLMSKIVVIHGDCRLPKLGISDENIETLIAETHYVFHVAAALKMDETIRCAYRSNVQATDEILKVASQMKKLESFIYVSTAYSQPRMEMKENFYEPTVKSTQLKNIIDKVPDEILEVLSYKVLENYPNTYALTKGIAEDVVKSYSDKVPLSIVRPSIVVGCAEEPFVGWVGSVNGATGVLLAASIGVMRVWGGHYKLHVDIIPADYLINMTIVAAWKTAQTKQNRHLKDTADPVYNYVCTPKAPTSWGEYMDLNEKSFFKDELFLEAMRFPYEFRLQPSWTIYRIQVILFHVLPGAIIDGLLKLFKSKPQLMKVYRKLHTLNSRLYFYCMRQWDFTQENVDSLWAEMTSNERKLFPFDMTGFAWKDYFEYCPRGMKVYLLKDPMCTVKELRGKGEIIGMIYYPIRWLLKHYFLYLSLKFAFSFTKTALNWILSY